MEREHLMDDLIVLGAITEETKGISNEPQLDSQGNFSGGGLSDD
ncbi:benenodin family lasso peptide [Novosphingobium sp. KACC 22771]|nr:benenodin family lasso peptide [Novosphingobium sp. KACC 22771]WDF74229.1 benenodin family lasso peptide [Novosphingobium sp. KACC 22771]